MRVLVIDNYDSFVFNLVQYLGQLGADCEVRRNDEIDLAEVGRLDVAGMLLSPGPGTPERAGICLDVIREYGGRLPILGVCLGHQAIGAAFGGTVTRAPELLHGKTSEVRHRSLPIEGVQFHPESVLTEGGHLMLANWLANCGLPSALDRAPALAAEVDTRRRAAFVTV